MVDQQFDFQRDVIDASKEKAVVVDFWAAWCAPCRILGPVLEKLAGESNGRWSLVKVNTEEQPQLAMQYHIQSIPAVKMFYNGKVVAEFVGALPETHVRKWLEDNLPTKSKQILEAANQALANGDKQQAQQLFEEAYREDKSNFEARIRLAELVLKSDPDRAFGLVKETPEEHPLAKNAEAIRTLLRLLNEYESIAQQAKSSKDAAQALELYLGGMQALRQHNYEEALKRWIDTLSISREIDDDGPRKACVALFTWLGHHHELSQKYHRAFTSALF